MPAYALEAITAEQALAIAATDTLTFAGGSAASITVLYSSADAATQTI